jgi:replication factor A1
MTTIKDATERVVKAFDGKGVRLDASLIEKDMTNLVSTYGMLLSEAERTITTRESKKHNVTLFERSEGLKDIGSVNKDEWVTVEGAITSLFKTAAKSIHQAGVISDKSGAIRFTVWSREKGGAMLPDMKIGKWYRISNATIAALKNSGQLNLNVHKGSNIVEIEKNEELKSHITNVRDIRPGIVNIRVKVTKLFQPSKDVVAQTGIVGDESGTTKFTIWRSDKPDIELKEGKSYLIQNAQCVEYKGNYNITISGGIKEIKEDIPVRSGATSFQGSIVQIRPGSGLVRRCPVENCNRVLSRQNYCPIHEIQNNFKYDMRIKAVADNGVKTMSVHVPLNVVEDITGMKLKDAISIAEKSPLGFDEVLEEITKAVFGRYFIIEGFEYPDRIHVTKFIPIEPDTKKAKELIAQTGV